MATQLEWMTADEFMAMPNDGTRRELVYGELREMTPPGLEHSDIVGNILDELRPYVRARKLGKAVPETSYRLHSDPDTVRLPDASFIRSERVRQIGRTRGFWPGPPDLAVEVVSPTDRARDVLDKVGEYLDAGTRMVVVVDPARLTVAVHRSRTEVTVLTENDVLEGGDVVPGWRLPVRDIFADRD
ncbi:MAG TPA: Uma2 family endonuclease [Longimicrobium sp.]|jgi:Uma2 family endonuclease|uniref:Uma2 family endonuclease n=1 Tax=Longimicrobium sp. TaxID=2029185 RepID=UPI002EDB6EFD